MADSQTYKIIVILDTGQAGTIGGVDYQGAVWLVPKWLSVPDEKVAMPERMIRLDQFQYQRFDPRPTQGPFAGADFAINTPLPRELLHGALSPALGSKYVVLDRPDVKFRTGGALN